MNAKVTVVLLTKLCSALEVEAAAIAEGDVEVLEKQGPEIERLFGQLQKVPDSVSGEEVRSLAVKAGEMRKDNIEKFQLFLAKTGKEIGGVRRGREVCRAYNPDKNEKELFVKKDC